MSKNAETHNEPLLRIVKREEVSKKKSIILRAFALLFAIDIDAEATIANIANTAYPLQSVSLSFRSLAQY